MQKVAAFRISFLSAEVFPAQELLLATTSDGRFDRAVPGNARSPAGHISVSSALVSGGIRTSNSVMGSS